MTQELIAALQTEPAIFGALRDRLTPPKRLPRAMDGSPARIKAEALKHFKAMPAHLIADIQKNLVLAGFCVTQLIRKPSADGRKLDMSLEIWPFKALTVDSNTGGLIAWCSDGTQVPVVHGNGTWCVFQAALERPWETGALVPLTLCWLSRAFGKRDQGHNVESHGMAKPFALYPDSLSSEDDEVKKLELAVQNLANADSYIVARKGTEIGYLEATTNAWQVFTELLKSEKQDISTILLGHDGALTAQGGNYRQAVVLGQVTQEIVEADIGDIGTALSTGLYVHWAAENFDREAELYPHWQMPDPDEDARRQSLAERGKAFPAVIEAYRGAGLEIKQDTVSQLAEDFGVPKADLAAAAQTSQLVLSVTDLPKIVTVDEGRAALGLPTIGETKTIAQFAAQAEAQGEATGEAAASGADAGQVP